MTTRTTHRSLIQDTFGAIIVRGLGIGLAFCATSLTARWLGPAELSIYAIGVSLAVLLATIAPLGTDRVLVQLLSQHRDPAVDARDVATTHRIAARSSLLMAGLLLTIAAALSAMTSERAWPHSLMLAATILMPQTLVYLRQWIAIPLVGTQRAVAPEQLLLPAACLMGLTILQWSGSHQSATRAALIYTGALTLIFAWSLRSDILGQLYRASWQSRSAPVTDSGVQIRTGVPYLTVAVGAVWTQNCVPLLVAVTCGLRESVFLALALPFAALTVIPLGIVNLSLLPQFTRLHRAGDRRGAQRLARLTASATLGIATVTGLIIYLASPLIPVLLGSDYNRVAELLPALLLACIVDALTGPTMPVVQAMGMQSVYSRLLAWYCPVQFILIAGLGAAGGVGGTAIAYCLSRCVWNVMIGLSIHRRLGLVMLPGLPSRQLSSSVATDAPCDGSSQPVTPTVPIVPDQAQLNAA